MYSHNMEYHLINLTVFFYLFMADLWPLCKYLHYPLNHNGINWPGILPDLKINNFMFTWYLRIGLLWRTMMFHSLVNLPISWIRSCLKHKGAWTYDYAAVHVCWCKCINTHAHYVHTMCTLCHIAKIYTNDESWTLIK